MNQNGLEQIVGRVVKSLVVIVSFQMTHQRFQMSGTCSRLEVESLWHFGIVFLYRYGAQNSLKS